MKIDEWAKLYAAVFPPRWWEVHMHLTVAEIRTEDNDFCEPED